MRLPVEIADTTVDIQFWIVEDQDFNLLGMTWHELVNPKPCYTTSSIEINGKQTAIMREDTLAQVMQAKCEDLTDPSKDNTAIPESLFATDLNEDSKEAALNILHKHEGTWAVNRVGCCAEVKHKIIVQPGFPKVTKLRKMSPADKQIVKSEISKLLKQGAIRPSSSEWAAPVVLIPKKNGETRMCIDYRALNKVTEKDTYPLPRIDDLIEAQEGAAVLSTLDSKAGYLQVQVREEDKHRAAFISYEGLYEYNVMPYGL